MSTSIDVRNQFLNIFMQCPKDKTGLRTLPVQNVTFDVCDACGGIWFDNEELKKVAQVFAREISGREQNFIEIVRENDVPDESRKQDLKYGEGICCLNDNTPTHRFIYAGDSHIILERCPLCGGTWFDGDELVRMKEYLKPNPLYDGLGRAMINEMQDFEQWKQEVEQLPHKLAYAFSSPTNFLIILAQMLMNYAEKMKTAHEGPR